MNGELLAAWPRTWREIWLRLAKSTAAPEDLFIVLVADVASPPVQPAQPPVPSAEAFNADGELVDNPSVEARRLYELAMATYSEQRDAYETALSSEQAAKSLFKQTIEQVGTEGECLSILEAAYGAIATYGNEHLTTRYRTVVNDFIVGFNLRYDLRGRFSLHATVPGLFSKLISELRKVARADPHLANLLSEYEEAFADLRSDRTQARMKTCLQKQFNMLEALGRRYPNVTATTLGAICDQLDWPHEKVKEVGKDLYRFGSDYPGVRHGGTPANALRNLEMKDFISLSLMLASFTPYVTYGLDSDRCYSG